jgi:hypothetical protein
MSVYIGYRSKIAAERSGDIIKFILNIIGLITTVGVSIYVTKIV